MLPELIHRFWLLDRVEPGHHLVEYQRLQRNPRISRNTFEHYEKIIGCMQAIWADEILDNFILLVGNDVLMYLTVQNLGVWQALRNKIVPTLYHDPLPCPPKTCRHSCTARLLGTREIKVSLGML